MEPVVDLNELTERIRQAANRANGTHAAPSGMSNSMLGMPTLSDALPPLMVSALTADLLDQAKQILPRAHRKNEAPATVPKLLRPFYRNQGGFNGVTLEILERLITANRQLAEQMGQFRDWTDAVGRDMARNRAWMTALETRQEAFWDERLIELEVRLKRLEQPPGTLLDPASDVSLADLQARIERLEKQVASPPDASAP